MKGTYYQTIHRNELTGETEFLFTPNDYYEETVDGLIRCIGTIDHYRYKLPLELNGAFQGQIFKVTSANYAKGEKETSQLLDYFFEGVKIHLKESEKRKIIKLSHGDLLSFMKQNPRTEELWNILKNNQKVAAIENGCQSLLERQEITALCRKQEIPFGKIDTLMNQGAAISKLKRNPYPYFIYAGIPLQKADGFMKEIHPAFSVYDPIRIYGYLSEAMTRNSQSGNSCIRPDQLYKWVNYRMEKSELGGSVSLSMINSIFHIKQKQFQHLKYQGETFLYLGATMEEEASVLRNLNRLNRTKSEVVTHIDLVELEAYAGFTFTQGQTKALSLLKTSGVKLLIGPPGSGKTALIRTFIKQYQKEYPQKPIRLAATTGRASQVLADACGRPAETLHKLLDIRPYGKEISSKDENHPIESDFIIVDEVSMMGLHLFSLLLKAVKSGSLLLLVGDKDQLQSVEYGNVLKDLQESGVIETYELTEVLRQSGLIYSNAQKINRGISDLKQANTFQIHQFHDPHALNQCLLENFHPDTDLVLTTIRKTELGKYALNDYIKQKIVRNNSEYLDYGKQRFHVGDRIIMNMTNYERGYFNGDMGWIQRIHPEGIMEVLFSHQTALALDKHDFAYIELAYAVTTHKAQGTEFPNVHIVLPDSSPNMLTRRNLYTAVTRAKENVWIYTMNDAMKYAISNQAEYERNSILGLRIRNELGISC